MKRAGFIKVWLLATFFLSSAACDQGTETNKTSDSAVVARGGAGGSITSGLGGSQGTDARASEAGSSDTRFVVGDARLSTDTNPGGTGDIAPEGGAIGDGGLGGRDGATYHDTTAQPVDSATDREARVTDGPAADRLVYQDAQASPTDAGPLPCQEPATLFDLPSSFGVPHASKAVLACGVHIIAASVVADAALLRAQKILQVQLRKIVDDLPGVDAKLKNSKSRLVILGRNEDQSVYWPKNSGRRSFCSWPDRNGMIETTTLEEELTSTRRAQLMTTVHEMGHFTQFVLYLYNKTLYDRSVSAFNNCTKSLYNSYDLQNASEFFAGDTLRWFDLNPTNLAVSDANTLSQRDQLSKHSVTMYQIMSETYITSAIP